MKTIPNVTVYQCDHCKKKYFRENACVSHEVVCFHNPANFRPCFGCACLIKKETAVTFDGDGEYGYQEWTEQKSVLYCSKFSMFMHTPQNEIKGNAFELDEHINEPMPKQCSERVASFGEINI